MLPFKENMSCMSVSISPLATHVKQRARTAADAVGAVANLREENDGQYNGDGVKHL